MNNTFIDNLTTLTKHQFVVVKTSTLKTVDGRTGKKTFEIGRVRENHESERTILILTDGNFTTNPPHFHENWEPFLINPDEEIPLGKHRLYHIDLLYVAELLEQQKQYLEINPTKELELKGFLREKALLLDEKEVLQFM